MISRYMGPHYGDDVSLPGAGTYQLSPLISPPVSARHLEYQEVWLKPHTASFAFPWKPASRRGVDDYSEAPLAHPSPVSEYPPWVSW
jgi:hypothetical protein